MEYINKINFNYIFFYIAISSLLYFLYFIMKRIFLSDIIKKNGTQFAIGYLLKNFGINFIVLKFIYWLHLLYYTIYGESQPTYCDLYLIIFGISPIIIWLLIRIIESQNFIIANIRFKIGDEYFYESDESKKIYKIDSIEDGNIHFSNLNDPYGFRKFKEPITVFIKKLDEGIIIKKVLIK